MYKSIELQILKEEENVLKDIEAKLKNQSTRLKVEELTLINHIRTAEDRNIHPATQPQAEDVTTDNQFINENEGEQNPKPLLELDVKNQLLMLVDNDEGEEEEEEEEEEEDVTDHDQLTAFMKQLEKNAP